MIMRKHLLLEGPSGVGKTTLILNMLGSLRRQTEGFVTQRMVDDTGRTCGFCLTPAKLADTAVIPYREQHRDAFIDCITNTYNFDVFINRGMKLLENVNGSPLILTDEIGGLELMEPIIFNKLTELFSKSIPCIGVLKSHDNCMRLMNSKSCWQLYPRYTAFRKSLETNPWVDIVYMSWRDVPEIAGKINEFIVQIEGKP